MAPGRTAFRPRAWTTSDAFDSTSSGRPSVAVTMRASRRRILGLFLFAGAWLRARRLLASAIKPSAPDDDRLKALPSYLDTLIPADRWSPAATAISVDRRVVEKTRTDDAYRRLLTDGCRWLDDTARRFDGAEFAALTEARRETIVGYAAAAPAGSGPRAFFEATRRDAFLFYYVRPESRAALGFDGPPQPAGFPDHARPRRS